MPFFTAGIAGAGLLAGSLLSPGDSPSAQNTSNQSPSQAAITAFLGPLLQARGINAPAYGGQMVAPLSGLQQTSLAALESAVLPGATGNAQAGQRTVGGANTALQSILAQGPDFSAGLFDRAVAQPMMKNFNERVIPSLESAYGANAGGISSSDYRGAVGRSLEDLNKALTSGAAGFALQNESAILGASGQATGLAAGSSSQIGQSLLAGAIPQQNAQAGLSASYSEFQRQNTQSDAFINQLIQYMGIPTQNTVVNPGQQGFLSGLAPGIGSALSAYGLSFL